MASSFVHKKPRLGTVKLFHSLSVSFRKALWHGAPEEQRDSPGNQGALGHWQPLSSRRNRKHLETQGKANNPKTHLCCWGIMNAKEPLIMQICGSHSHAHIKWYPKTPSSLFALPSFACAPTSFFYT